MADDVADGARPAGVRRWRRFLPLALLVAGFALFFALGLQHELSLETLRTHREALEGWVAAHPLLSALLFGALYVLIVAFSIPGGAVMTLAGGFLFGTWEGGGLVVVAATIGATIIFLAARTALHDLIEPARRHTGAGDGGGLPQERLQLSARAAADSGVSLFPRQSRRRAAGGVAAHLCAGDGRSASCRAPSSMPGSATGWARSSRPAARPIWASSSSRPCSGH